MIRRSAAVAIAITIGQLIAGRRSGWTADQELVLDALRRSTGALASASEEELADYLATLSPQQMQGVVSNVKGIFHEVLVAAAENADGDNVQAVSFEATNHPGADLEFVMDGEIVGSVQLKAVQSPSAIVEHFERYPDVDVLATSEVTALLQGRFGDRLASSQFSNEELTETTRAALEDLIGEDLGDFIQDGLMTSALLGGALQARALLSGQALKPEQLRSYAELAGISVGTALAVDTVLNLL